MKTSKCFFSKIIMAPDQYIASFYKNTSIPSLQVSIPTWKFVFENSILYLATTLALFVGKFLTHFIGRHVSYYTMLWRFCIKTANTLQQFSCNTIINCFSLNCFDSFRINLFFAHICPEVSSSGHLYFPTGCRLNSKFWWKSIYLLNWSIICSSSWFCSFSYSFMTIQ